MGNNDSAKTRNNDSELLNLILNGPVEEPLVCSSLSGEIHCIIFPKESDNIEIHLSNGNVNSLSYEFQNEVHIITVSD